MGAVASATYTQCCSWREHTDSAGSPYYARPGYTQATGTYEAVTVGGPRPTPSGTKKALLIGCNYPNSQAELCGCVNDVMRMSSLLRSRYGFSPFDMQILTDDGQGPHGPSTRSRMLAGMRWLAEGAKPGDVLFFHFSGHGAQQEDPSYTEEDGFDETILPTDWEHAGMIVDDEIFDTMIAPLPSGVKLTAVMDCCHSGTGLDLPFVFNIGNGWFEEDNPCHSAGDVVLFSGCMDEQTSMDATNGCGEAAGAMTTALCDTLEEYPIVALTFEQLLQSLKQKLHERGFDQRANLTSSQRFDAATRKFSICDEIEPNNNIMLGRHFRKRKHPKVDFGGAFGDMLSMAGQAMAMYSLYSTLQQHPFGAQASKDGHEGTPPTEAEIQSAPLAGFGEAEDSESESDDYGALDDDDGDDDDGDW